MAERGLLLRNPLQGWGSSAFEQLFPGGHAIVFGPYRVALEAEEAGFEVRDCIVVMGPGKQQRVWLLRKPIEQQNIAQQVLKTGTGGLWIDGCRTPSGGYTSSSKSAGSGSGYGMTPKNTFQKGLGGIVEPAHPGGRWPTNLVFVHGPECREQGTKTEVCQPGCPVRALDRQSGARPSTGPHPSEATSESILRPDQGAYQKQGPLYDDQGGASRFFPRFRDDQELDRWLLRLILGCEPPDHVLDGSV